MPPPPQKPPPHLLLIFGLPAPSAALHSYLKRTTLLLQASAPTSPISAEPSLLPAQGSLELCSSWWPQVPAFDCLPPSPRSKCWEAMKATPVQAPSSGNSPHPQCARARTRTHTHFGDLSFLLRTILLPLSTLPLPTASSSPAGQEQKPRASCPALPSSAPLGPGPGPGIPRGAKPGLPNCAASSLAQKTRLPRLVSGEPRL